MLQVVVRWVPLVVAALLLSCPVAHAQLFWSEDFENDCLNDCLASGYEGWTVRDNVGGTTGTVYPSQWYVSSAEAGLAAPECAGGDVGDETLHIGRHPVAGGDQGAFYDFDPTYRLAVSPAISTVGQGDVMLTFDVISLGDGYSGNDRAELWFSFDDGVTWPAGLRWRLDPHCCGACVSNSGYGYVAGAPRWTEYSTRLGPLLLNNANVRIGFYWRNGPAGLAGPSVAIDDIRLLQICNNHHISYDAPYGISRCECRPEYAGAECGECSVDHYGYPTCTFCSAATTCYGHGTCSAAGSCDCSPGFTGANCQFGDATTCNGHGTAQPDGGCTCAPEFAGATCSECAIDHFNFPECVPCTAAVTCNDRGSCDPFGACACASGFAGPACQFGDATTCSGNGTAQMDGSCVCTAGFTGASCMLGLPDAGYPSDAGQNMDAAVVDASVVDASFTEDASTTDASMLGDAGLDSWDAGETADGSTPGADASLVDASFATDAARMMDASILDGPDAGGVDGGANAPPSAACGRTVGRSPAPGGLVLLALLLVARAKSRRKSC